jgi:hypothetical protein
MAAGRKTGGRQEGSLNKRTIARELAEVFALMGCSNEVDEK